MGWTIQTIPNPASAEFADLFAVSCTSATDCTAIGSYVVSGGGGRTLAEHWDGTQWSIEDTPNRSGTSYGTLHAISCASASACLAVGYDSTGPLVERWDGMSWKIETIPAPADAQDVSLTGVSCTSASACTVSGSWITSVGHSVALAERWDGTSWTIQATASATREGSLSDVSCNSATSCTAVGFTGGLPLAEHWDGTGWTIQATPNPTGALSSGLDRVACDSSGACTAVATHIDGSGSQAPLAERWDGTSWTIQGTPTVAGAVATRLTSVACPSASVCIAAGSATTAGTVTLAEHWDGTSWTIGSTPNPSGSLGSKLLGVWCTSEIACTAVGSAGEQTLAEHWDGMSWQIEPTPNAVGAQSSILQAVSCPTAASCIAVGSYTTTTGYTAALIERWDGTSWRVEQTPDPGVTGSALQAVSCSTPTACLAVGGGLAELWNGMTWSLTPAPTGDLKGVSCPLASACTAVGSDGDRTLAERWDGTSWTTQPTPNSSYAYPSGAYPSTSVLQAISCTSASGCMAVGSGGFTSPMSGYHPQQTLIEQWHGSGWTLVANPSEAAFSSLAGVSCKSVSTCIAVGSSGNGTLALGWDGFVWTIQTAPTASGGLQAISCVAPGSCTAVGSVANGISTPMTLVEQYTASPPTLLSRPSIAGLAQQGQTFREVHGSWSNDPTSFSYQWERCDSAGLNCIAIPQATNQTYTLTPSDVGETIAVSESARNAAGASMPVRSASTPVVRALAAPTTRAPPRISGTAQVWYELSASTGTWTGTQPITYAYHWQRCKPLCANIAKATRRSYILTQPDRGARIRVLVRATNTAGSTQAHSPQTKTVAGAASRGQVKAQLLRKLTPSGKAAKIAALLKAGNYALSLTALTAGRITIEWYYLRGTGNARPKPIVVASGKASSPKAGAVRLTIKLTASGKHLLKHANRLQLSSKGTYVPTGQKSVTGTKRFTLKR